MMPPSDFSGRTGRCGVHSSPFLNSGCAGGDHSLGEYLDRRCRAGIGQGGCIFKGYIKIGDGIKPGCHAFWQPRNFWLKYPVQSDLLFFCSAMFCYMGSGVSDKKMLRNFYMEPKHDACIMFQIRTGCLVPK